MKKNDISRFFFVFLRIIILVSLDSSIFAAAEKVDGTTGIPIGGFGTGAVKFCSNKGTFARIAGAPGYGTGYGNDYSTMNNTFFQFYSNRGGTIQTSNKLTAVQSGGRYDDDAIYPIQTANFGTINNINISLTAFCSFNLTNADQMSYPYAFYEIKLVNTTNSAVDAACALQIGTDVTPVGVSGKGIRTSGGLEWADYAKSDAASYTVSYGNDNGFFIRGVCNNSLSGTTNRTAVKLTLAANETKTVKFVLAWYNGNNPTHYYYSNTFNNAGSVAETGLTSFDIFRDNAVNFVTRMRASNYPKWLKNQTLNSLCNLSNNSIYTQDGRYLHTEGQWSCNGTMDQMWHARQINTMIAPSIAWQELQYWARTQKTNPAGQIHHDFKHPDDVLPAWDETDYADYRDIDTWVDLNCGFIISVYEAFLATDDHTRLDYFWPYVKKAGQRVFDQVAAFGNTTYPYTFDSSRNSYDAGGGPDPYNASISVVTYKIMSNLCAVKGDATLKSIYDNAFNTAKMSFQNRYLSGNFPVGRICESAMAGQWLAYYLKLGELFPTSNIDYAIGCLDSYYHPRTNGMGYSEGTYDEWAPYLISHYGGFLLQTSRVSYWESMQYDMYRRSYLNRNKVFNQRLDILPQVSTPNYVATETSGYDQYISIPVLWRNYYSLVGYQRNKHTGELWIEPVLLAEMNHTLTNGFFVTPEGCGIINYTESGSSYQNQNITIKSDNNVSVAGVYIKDTFGTNVTVTIGGAAQSINRIGTGYAKEIKINWSGTIGAGGINIVATGDAPPTVSITSPANGATFTAPASVTINAAAADSDGTVSKVDFYRGTTLLGTDTSSPYSYSWTNVAAGSYILTAKATDNGGYYSDRPGALWRNAVSHPRHYTVRGLRHGR
jgi:uncharacterized protein (DUF608 family)